MEYSRILHLLFFGLHLLQSMPLSWEFLENAFHWAIGPCNVQLLATDYCVTINLDDQMLINDSSYNGAEARPVCHSVLCTHTYSPCFCGRRAMKQNREREWVPDGNKEVGMMWWMWVPLENGPTRDEEGYGRPDGILRLNYIRRDYHSSHPRMGVTTKHVSWLHLSH